MTSAFATVLRSRRARDLATLLLAVGGRLLGPLQLAGLLGAAERADWDRLAEVRRGAGVDAARRRRTP